MLAFVPVVPAAQETVPAPVLPTFRPRWWYRNYRLDARPVAWSLRNRPEDWRWNTEGITLRHVPSDHVFWIANGSYSLYTANCSCQKNTRGRFQRFQALFVFRPAYRYWLRWQRLKQQQEMTHDPAHFAEHFIR